MAIGCFGAAILLILTVSGNSLSDSTVNVTAEESQAKQFIAQLNPRLEQLNTEQVEASWQFNTNISKENEVNLVIYIAKQYN